MLKGSRRGRVSELSGAFFSLFNFASFGNCGGIPRAPVANSFPRTNGTGTAQGKSPHALGWPPLSWQRSKPCFQWRRYLAPPHYQVVHLDITSQYLVEKHECWPIYIDGTGAHAYSPVEGMAFRWMVDASGFNWHFHLIWRFFLLVVPINDHMVSDTPCTSRKERW